MAKRKRLTRRLRRSRKQRGGFSPMIYGGVQNAAVLMPIVFRQAYRLINDRRPGSKTRRVRRTRKH